MNQPAPYKRGATLNYSDGEDHRYTCEHCFYTEVLQWHKYCAHCGIKLDPKERPDAQT